MSALMDIYWIKLIKWILFEAKNKETKTVFKLFLFKFEDFVLIADEVTIYYGIHEMHLMVFGFGHNSHF